MRLGATAMTVLLLSNACTDQVIGEFGGAGTVSTSESSNESVSTAGQESASTCIGETAGPSSTESGTSAAIPEDEICDGIDNDLDGLTDEVSSTNSACGECTLLQGEGQAWWICDDTIVDWEEASGFCAAFGATNATITNSDTQLFLEDTLEAAWYWLSVRQEPEEGQWLWPDGSSLSYTNWAGNQPDNWTADQNCVRLTFGLGDPPNWFTGAWDDFECAKTLAVLCSATHTFE
ncbi:MAG: C-type lectin domain-containing protein [Nannocystaceae bacterium]|nr:C-type lectin domain-containing protein [Nannocystaceae bacterium]